MNLKFSVATLAAIIAGIGSGLLACRAVICRDMLGQICGRGHLLALVQARGIYAADVDRATAELRFRRGSEDLVAVETSSSNQASLAGLIRIAAAECLATDERIAASSVENELDLLRSQFHDRQTWITAVRSNRLSEMSLRRMIKEDLRVQKWIDRQTLSRSEVSTEERQQFYKQHAETFAFPVRIRISHLFLAAPPETASNIVDLKKEKIDALAKRIRGGESFLELVATESEDEATKVRGGDLGYFSAYRMPGDFFEAAMKVRPGEISGPIRTALGFHIIKAIDLQPSRLMTFEEANQEIEERLERGRRQAALERVDVALEAQVRVNSRSFERKL